MQTTTRLMMIISLVFSLSTVSTVSSFTPFIGRIVPNLPMIIRRAVIALTPPAISTATYALSSSPNSSVIGFKDQVIKTAKEVFEQGVQKGADVISTAKYNGIKYVYAKEIARAQKLALLGLGIALISWLIKNHVNVSKESQEATS